MWRVKDQGKPVSCLKVNVKNVKGLDIAYYVLALAYVLYVGEVVKLNVRLAPAQDLRYTREFNSVIGGYLGAAM